jgi:hypothetical protein
MVCFDAYVAARDESTVRKIDVAGEFLPFASTFSKYVTILLRRLNIYPGEVSLPLH